MKNLILFPALFLVTMASAQVATAPKADSNDIAVKIKALAGFRGAVANQIQGIGLVTGLAGTGDTKRSPQSQKAVINLLRDAGLEVDATSETKNVALVALTAQLPAYARPGGKIEVTVSILGDGTSLRGGVLLSSNLRAPGSPEVIATVAGNLNVGGFNVSAGGNSVAKGGATKGTIPDGIIQKGLLMKTLFDGKMYLDLSDADPTLAQRVQDAVNKKNPDFRAFAYDASTIEITLPQGMSENQAQSLILEANVLAPSEASVVIDAQNGTIIIGSEVRISPCVVVQGGLTIKVTDTPFVSQPAPLSNGKTVTGSVKTVDVNEQTAEFAAVRGTTSIGDLAAMFRALRLKANDVATILMTMRTQGALKARIEVK